MRTSKTFDAVVLAYKKGYRADNRGMVRGPSDKPRKRYAHGKKFKYWTFGIGQPKSKRVLTVQVSHLVALQKFGVDAFQRSECVRHLNGNSLDDSFDNIAIGSQRDNMLDIPKDKRVAKAIYASAFSCKSRKDWAAIDEDRAAGMSYRAIADKYGISKGALSYRYSKTASNRRRINR